MTQETADRVLALIDNLTETIWYVSKAQSLERACEFTARATSERGHLAGMSFTPTPALKPGEVGYSIHDATDLPPPLHGEREELDMVRGAPLIRRFRQIG
jgi:hypothetical protein